MTRRPVCECCGFVRCECFGMPNPWHVRHRDDIELAGFTAVVWLAFLLIITS